MPNDQKPFNNIGLCLSGGGFRSAAYGLGVLNYLNGIGLMQNVKSISSVSGGSIVGMKYVEWLCGGGQNYEDFSSQLYQYLLANNLHNEAVKILNDGQIWLDDKYKHKERNLINSFAIAYDQLLNGKTIADLNIIHTHLSEYVFNATDMNTALQFRFKNTGVFGNNAFKSVKKEIRNKIKLGDVLAASSCFPGGFEPIVFPDDFIGKSMDTALPSIPLMDGGIVNNQGVDHYLIKSKIGETLIFMADVESYKVANPFTKIISNRFITIFSFLTSGATSIALLFICGLIYMMAGASAWAKACGLVLFTAFVLLFLLQMVLFNLLKAGGEKIGLKDVLIFHPKRYGVYIINRLTSFKSLAESIFLKNNRRKSLEFLYNKLDKEGGAPPLLCPIYRLTSTGDSETRNWEYINNKLGDPYPSKKMLDTVNKAASFGTTLWFDDKNKKDILEALVKTGEMTACFSILTYCISEEAEGRLKCDDLEFYLQLVKDWKGYQSL